MTIHINNVEEELTELLLKELNAANLETCAEITIRRDQFGKSISISPFDSNRAELFALYENGSPIVYLTLGTYTVLEVPLDGGRYTDKVGIDELISIVRTVATRGFDERIWEIKGKVVKSISTLWLPDEDKPVTIRSYRLHNPFAKKTEITKEYLPYFYPTEAHDT